MTIGEKDQCVSSILFSCKKLQGIFATLSVNILNGDFLKKKSFCHQLCKNTLPSRHAYLRYIKKYLVT